MQIEREKFFALTAALAGFSPTAACVVDVAGEAATPTTPPREPTPRPTTGAPRRRTPVRSFGP